MRRLTKSLLLCQVCILVLGGCDNCCNFRCTNPAEAIKPVVIHNDNFTGSVLESERLVLVDFYAPWCGVCKSMEPVVEAVATQFDGRVTVGKLNVDDNQAIASRYDVELIPQFLLFKDGQLVQRLGGILSKEEMVAQIEDVLRADGGTP